MQDKKKTIIEASIERFAKQGFHATSVQEIVDKAKVAKGSFYNYFDSKEDLIVSIYDYYYASIRNKMENATQSTTDPRESLAKQLDIYFQFIIENQSLIIMLLRDQVPLGKDMESFILKMKQQDFEWTSDNVRKIYGEAIEPYLIDVAVILDGMLKSYSNWLVINSESVNMEHLSYFIIERLDDISLSMINNKAKPAIAEVPKFLKEKELIINKIRQKIHSMVNTGTEKATEALDVLDQELAKSEPQTIVIESMLEHLQQFDALKEDIDQLKRKIGQ
ncbi:hypothetical protein CEY16_07520 [Halalkalibacillus sediminis]|uniref:HTH tetR-type domain-containing protein n=1 Tax=Halalkalibacillus sediminis TaxID=2018042 RepID=A0A2I0QTV3_9BACI|nr:TetR/AcrR family transcriptional regulator [Halalkalibacillus sediminis]PKR77771.1 hypothetical protein CEY16_07520 [Halalkalibacillus sediminis]